MLGFELSDQIPPELPPKKANNDELERIKGELEQVKFANQELELAKCNIEMQLENAFIERKLVKDQYDDQNRSMTTLKYQLQTGQRFASIINYRGLILVIRISCVPLTSCTLDC